MMYQDAARHARSVMNKPAKEGNGALSSSRVNPAKTPKAGSAMAVSASKDSKTAYCGMPLAHPLMACGSTSSPYLVRMTCQATMSPLVASPTVPTRSADLGVAVREAAANHQRMEKNERLP